VRARAWQGAIAGAVLAASSYVALSAPLGHDYRGSSCKDCDFAGPPIDALVHGHVSTFFSTQPFMGSVSLLLRAPVVWLVQRLGGDELWQYRLGSLACLLVAAALVWLVVSLMQRRGQSALAQLTVIVLILSGPMTFKSLYWGHPEELMGAALAVGGVLLAGHGRGLLAGIALGLAVATKQWALLAVLPAVMVAGDQRKHLLAGGGLVAAAFTLPMLLGDPSRFIHQSLNAGVGSGEITPTNLWWPFHFASGEYISPGHAATLYSIPGWLGRISHPLVVMLGLGLSLLYWHRNRDRHSYDALQLLALLFLLRCVLDPLTFSYHHLPFLTALAVFEGLRRRGLPLVSLASAGALGWIAYLVAPNAAPDTLNLAYLAWALPTVAYLAVLCFVPNARLSVRAPQLDQPALAPSAT
jgi:glycosyl transferase family 87